MKIWAPRCCAAAALLPRSAGRPRYRLPLRPCGPWSGGTALCARSSPAWRVAAGLFHNCQFRLLLALDFQSFNVIAYRAITSRLLSWKLPAWNLQLLKSGATRSPLPYNNLHTIFSPSPCGRGWGEVERGLGERSKRLQENASVPGKKERGATESVAPNCLAILGNVGSYFFAGAALFTSTFAGAAGLAAPAGALPGPPPSGQPSSS